MQVSTHLGETDSSRLFTEALTAEVKAVLAYETPLVGAEAAKQVKGESARRRKGPPGKHAHH